jgi:lipopolysaccharide export LptBFGC system permease protein LptF
MTFDLSQKTGKIDKKPKGMTLAELQTAIGEYKLKQINTNPLIAEFHRKISWAFAPLIFILLGFPIAVITHRRQKSANLLLAVVFAAPYYLMSLGCQALASQGLTSPDLIMWAPNIIGGIIVLILNYKLCAS